GHKAGMTTLSVPPPTHDCAPAVYGRSTSTPAERPTTRPPGASNALPCPPPGVAVDVGEPVKTTVEAGVVVDDAVSVAVKVCVKVKVCVEVKVSVPVGVKLGVKLRVKLGVLVRVKVL